MNILYIIYAYILWFFLLYNFDHMSMCNITHFWNELNKLQFYLLNSDKFMKLENL